MYVNYTGISLALSSLIERTNIFFLFIKQSIASVGTEQVPYLFSACSPIFVCLRRNYAYQSHYNIKCTLPVNLPFAKYGVANVKPSHPKMHCTYGIVKINVY